MIPILLGHVSTRRSLYVTISRDYVPIRRFHYVPLEWELSHQCGCQSLSSLIQYFLAILTSQINETIPILLGHVSTRRGLCVTISRDYVPIRRFHYVPLEWELSHQCGCQFLSSVIQYFLVILTPQINETIPILLGHVSTRRSLYVTISRDYVPIRRFHYVPLEWELSHQCGCQFLSSVIQYFLAILTSQINETTPILLGHVSTRRGLHVTISRDYVPIRRFHYVPLEWEMSHQCGCQFLSSLIQYFLVILTPQINETFSILLGHVSTRRGLCVKISQNYVPIRRFHYVPFEWELSHQCGCQFLSSVIQYFLAILTSQINETILILLGHVSTRRGIYVTISRDFVPIRRFHYVPLEWELLHQCGFQFLSSLIQYFLAILTSQINETIPILLGHVSTRRGLHVTISRDYVTIRRFHYVPLEWELSHQCGCQFLSSLIQYFLAILTSQINETIPILLGHVSTRRGLYVTISRDYVPIRQFHYVPLEWELSHQCGWQFLSSLIQYFLAILTSQINETIPILLGHVSTRKGLYVTISQNYVPIRSFHYVPLEWELSHQCGCQFLSSLIQYFLAILTSQINETIPILLGHVSTRRGLYVTKSRDYVPIRRFHYVPLEWKLSHQYGCQFLPSRIQYFSGHTDFPD